MVEVWLGSVVGSVSLSLAMVGVGVATVGEVVAIVVYVCRLVGSWDGFLSFLLSSRCDLDVRVLGWVGRS